MTTTNYDSLKSQDIDVSASASYSGIVSVSGGFSLDKSQKEKASKFQSKVETKVITVGAPPSASGDAMEWAASVKNNPVPMEIKLKSIEHLFTDTYMSGLGSHGLTSAIVQQMHTKITFAKAKYCEYVRRYHPSMKCQTGI